MRWTVLPLVVVPSVLLVSRVGLASTLAADTGSAVALFTPTQTVPVTFTATGASGETVSVTFQDAEGSVIDQQTLQVSGDPWTGTVMAPSAKLGFYRVYGTLSDGTTITAVGTLAQADGSASFVTYAVIPDPAGRAASITEDHAFFGLVGGFNVGPEILAQLGVRWIKDSQWSWAAMEPYANQRNTFAPTPGSFESSWTNGGKPWRAFTLPNLTVNGRPYAGTPDVCVPGTFAYNTCALDPGYDQDWQTFVARVAAQWPAVYPSRTRRYYEMTWEPIYPWGYGGTAQQLVELYALAYPAMKAVDPNALVVGPTMFVEGPAGDADDELAAGLTRYIDVFSTHPYVINDVGWFSSSLTDWGYWDPELGGLPSRLATMARKVAAAAGHAITTIGTEQGYPTHQQAQYEIDQARRLIRQNLILLGLGWRMNIAFAFADYDQGVDNQWKDPATNFWDYGFFYNLDEATYGGYGPTKVSPKPVAAAYAAMTWMLENRRSVNDVNWLGDTTRGYVYESYDDPKDEVLALWDFGTTPSQVTIDTGATSVQVVDWMGNARTEPTAGGNLTLSITNEPTYVKGVSSTLWGSARAGVDLAQGKTVTTSGDGASDAGTPAPGSLAVDGDVWANESRWISSTDANDKWIAVDLGTDAQVGGVRFYTGEYVPAAHQNVYGGAVGAYHVQRWDGASWIDVVARTDNTRSAVDESFATVTTSKVRLLFDAEGTTTQVKLYEVQVLAAPAPAGSVDGGSGRGPADGGGTVPSTEGGTASMGDVDGSAQNAATGPSGASGCACSELGSGTDGAGAAVAGIVLAIASRRRRRTL